MSLSVPLSPLDCQYDLVSLGEVMLRLDPGDLRIRTARHFSVWEGGGEYNVARALARTFRRRTAVLSSLVDNEVGALIESLMMSGGVDTSWIHWQEFDGVGNFARNALNFTERGFGVRGAVGVSDRGHSAASKLHSGDLELSRLFGDVRTRWLHTGGIFAGLSPESLTCAREVIDLARSAGTMVSVDLNYRASLFQGPDGERRSRETFESLAERADVLIGGFSDFQDRLGVSAPDARAPEGERFAAVASELMQRYPQLRIVASTIRRPVSASIHTWGARALTRDGEYAESRLFENLAILDRVGGGDGFVAGLVHALLDGSNLQTALDIGAAHGALAMTTPGDNSMASLAEVLQVSSSRTVGERR